MIGALDQLTRYSDRSACGARKTLPGEEAYELGGKKAGFRNAQMTVIAPPTVTIVIPDGLRYAPAS